MSDNNNDNTPESPQQIGRPSLLSGLHRPTLAGSRGTAAGPSTNNNEPDQQVRADFEETLAHIPARPRRLWKVSDTALPSIPPFYPLPLNRRLTAYVSDASPSVVAVRLAEALRRRSIAVEYDDETCTATCLTADRCRFVIYLWQAVAPTLNATAAMNASLSDNTTTGSSNGTGNPSGRTTSTANDAPGLLVEFRRASGDVISFHRAVADLKKAAKSHGTGQDLRPTQFTAPMEFPRFVAMATEKPTQPCPDPNSPSTAALEGLEHAVMLLRKDRLDAQLRGMEQVLHLSDAVTSGLDIAFTACLAVMGAPLGATSSTAADDFSSAAQTLHQDWIYKLLVDRELPDEHGPGPTVDELAPEEKDHRETALAFLCGFGGDHDAGQLNDKQIEQMRHERVRMGDEYHGGTLRSMALRILANALGLLSKHNPKTLYTTLSTKGGAMMSDELFQALWHDAAGAARPPGIVAGTRLASPHEAALAIRCIRLLGQAHPKAKQRLAKGQAQNLAQLEKCYFIGQANHELLEYEAKRTYRFLTSTSSA